MSIIALDISLTSTGVAYETGCMDAPYYVSRILPKKLRGASRLAFVTRTITGMVDHRLPSPCALIVMEGPAFGMQQNNTRAHSLGELHGAIKFFAIEKNIDILIAPPTNLKKFVTGYGNATKDEVITGVKQMWGMELPHDDEADAFGLLQLARAFQSRRVRRQYSAAQQEALVKCALHKH